jgi:membrane-bound lytic murein transglycosylase D
MEKIMKFSLIAAAILLTACVSHEQPEIASGPVVAKTGADELNKLIAEVDSEILTDDKTFQEEELSDSTNEAVVIESEESAAKSENNANGNVLPLQTNESLKIPMELNSRVEEWITYFTERDRERFQRFLNRGEKYKAQVVEILRDYGVPTELYYLAMIESGFVTEAKSHASAVGIWQFIAGTGKRYGLERNNYLDERIDPLRATMAAAAYLKDLNRVFQSWYLAMAAYNAGEGRILQSIMKSNTRDFWELVKKSALPKETMNYVPKFLAAAIIGHNPGKFGFKIEKEGDLPELVQVAVPSPIKLSAISDVIGVPLDKLKEYNPHLRRSMTPPGKGEYEIWVPSSSAEILAQSQGDLRKNMVQRNSAPAIEEEPVAVVQSDFHQVRRGETLARIARKYGTTTAAVRGLNGLRSNRVRIGTKLRIVPAKLTETLALATPTKYRVQRGDNLAKIANKFGVSVLQLKKVNRLRRTRGLRVGQLLKIAANQT